MILRDRVGGGGRAKVSLCAVAAAEERLLDFTVSLGCMGNGALGDDALPPLLASMADGGSSNDIWSEDSCFVLSWPLISVEEAGVGSIACRGILEGPVPASRPFLSMWYCWIPRVLRICIYEQDGSGK